VSNDTSSNRITTAGFAYDAVGNQVRAIGSGGSSSQRFKYDAANRLVQVRADDNTTVRATYTYGDSNERLIADEAGLRTYYVWGGTCEYIESGSSTTPAWAKSYVYLGGRLLATLTPNGSGGEAVQYHHPDRLGTRLVTDPLNGTSFEQVTLPFGTPLNAESTGATNRRFTSYDRSATTGLDYANNRHYDSQQGRFTQVDPAGMDAVDLASPQTLNLYAYCANDPINHIDPSGLGFFSFLKKILVRIVHAAIHAAFTFLTTLLLTGSVHAAFVAGVVDFFKELGLPSKGPFPGSPQWNPNAHPILGGGIGPLSRYIIVNFAQRPGQEPDVLQFWIWAPGNKIAALMRRIKQALCRAVPSGRTSGVQGSMGSRAGPTVGVELVQNFRSGQISGFAFGGGQVGVVGGFSGQVNTGFIWGRLEDSNSNYAGPFASTSGSIGKFGGFIQSGSGLTVVGASAGLSMTPFTATAGVTKYTKPLPLGRWWYQALNNNAIDGPLILANQACR
jgi:RHS repeat-associated protein